MLRLFDPTTQFQDRNGALLVGGSVTVYYGVTDDLAEVRNDNGELMAQPVQIDSNGRVDGLFVDEDKTYRLEVKTPSGGTLYTVPDMVPGASGPGVAEAIEALDYTDTPESHKFVTKVSEQNGVISVERAQPAINDVDGLQAALDGKEDVANKAQGVNDQSTTEYPSSKAVADFVYGILRGSVKVYDSVGDLPAEGQEGIQYYVQTGADSYDLYVWAYIESESAYDYVKVSSGTVDLTGYVNNLEKVGSGSAVLNIAKSGSTVTATLGDLAVANITGLETALGNKQDALSKTGSKYNISISGNADTATSATSATTASNYANGGTIATALGYRIERQSVDTYNNGTKRVKIMSFSVASLNAGACSEIVKFTNVSGTGRNGSSVTLLVELAWREGDYNVNARILDDTGWDFKNYIPNVVVIAPDTNTRNIYVGFVSPDATSGYLEMVYVRTNLAILALVGPVTTTASAETNSFTTGQTNNFISPESVTPLYKITAQWSAGSHNLDLSKPGVRQFNLASGSHEVYLDTNNGSDVHVKLRLYTATPNCCNVDIYYVDEGGDTRCISIYSRDFEDAFGNCIELDLRGRKVGNNPGAFRVVWES